MSYYQMELAELLKKLEKVTFTSDEANEEVYIDFSIDGMTFYLRLNAWDGPWEPDEVCHACRALLCPVCGEAKTKHSTCKKMSSPTQILYDLSLKLLNHPAIRVKALLHGVKLEQK